MENKSCLEPQKVRPPIPIATCARIAKSASFSPAAAAAEAAADIDRPANEFEGGCRLQPMVDPIEGEHAQGRSSDSLVHGA